MKKNYISFYLINIFVLIFSCSCLSQIIKTDVSCPQGMISYWKFDELGGVTTFLDSYGGNNAICTVTARPSEDTGIVNKGRLFDTSSVVSAKNYNVYNWTVNNNFSIEAWVKTIKPGTGNKVFVGRTASNTFKMSWWLGYGDNNKAIFSVRDSGGIKTQIEGTKVINDGNWHLVVGTVNRSSALMQLFVDGVEENRQTTFFTGDFVSTSPLYIGVFGSSFHFQGTLDEVAIYSTNLSSTIIANHFNAGKQKKGYCDEFTTGIEESFNTPSEFNLNQNYPNPFNPSTTIKYSLPKSSFVTLKVFDILGGEVATLVNVNQPAGFYNVDFEGADLSSGIYFYSLTAGNFHQSRKMLLLK